MNPHQRNKIDINSLSPEEQRVFRLYGKLPNKTDLLQNKLKERKYFDSGDYALSKAGKASDAGVTSIGREHPSPENIPHSSSSLSHSTSHNGSFSGSMPGVNLTPSVSNQGYGGSPVKEGTSYLQHETSMDQVEGEQADGGGQEEQGTEHASAKPVMIEKSR